MVFYVVIIIILNSEPAVQRHSYKKLSEKYLEPYQTSMKVPFYDTKFCQK